MASVRQLRLMNDLGLSLHLCRNVHCIALERVNKRCFISITPVYYVSRHLYIFVLKLMLKFTETYLKVYINFKKTCTKVIINFKKYEKNNVLKHLP